MIRPFGLNDIWLVRRLQRRGMTLAVEHMLTHPHEPLWTALTAPWPWAGVGVATFVLAENIHGQQLQGFAQLLKRASRPEADLLHVAPAVMSAEPSSSTTSDGAPQETLGYDRSADAAWSRLLAHCSFAAATHGLQRMYASAPEGCYEQTSLKQAGFCLYTRETIYRLASVPKTTPSTRDMRGQGVRAQHPRDSWALQRLYTRSTPRLVQQAEGALSGGASSGAAPGSPLFSWWEPNDWQGWVLEPAGEVRGAVQVHRGRAGHWLRILGASELSARELRLLIEQGLRSLDKAIPLQDGRHIPVYITVRDYEMNLSGGLVSFGFAPLMERARFVKHTTAVVRIAEPVPTAVRELVREVGVHFGASPQPTARHHHRLRKGR